MTPNKTFLKIRYGVLLINAYSKWDLKSFVLHLISVAVTLLNSISFCYWHLLSCLWYVTIRKECYFTDFSKKLDYINNKSFTNLHNKHHSFMSYSNNRKYGKNLFWLCNILRLCTALVGWFQKQNQLSMYKVVFHDIPSWKIESSVSSYYLVYKSSQTLMKQVAE